MHINTLHFESGEGLGPEAPAEASPEGAESEALAAAAPDFGQFAQTPEFQEAIGQAVFQTLGQIAEQSGGEPGSEQPEASPELDAFGDPTEFRTNLQGLIQREIQQAIEPMLPAVERMEVADWQEKIDRTIDGLETVKEIDQYLPEDTPDAQRGPVVVERLATAFLPEMRQVYGDGERALEASLRAAADYFLPIAKQMHAAGYSARGAELQRLSGAPAPAPMTGGPAEILEEPQDEFDALERYSARHGLQ